MTQTLFTKNFTLLVFGQASSLFGNFILKFALSMYVLEVTGSATIFAGILAMATIPTILLSPLGGILADRANRRNIMIRLDTFSGLSILCATLVFSSSNDIVVISILLVILSILGAFETPTVQACVPQMQTGDHIIQANAVVSQVAAVSSFVAPIIGSVLYVAFGLKPVMVVSTVCFFLTALLECLIQLEYIPYDDKKGVISMIKSDFSVSMQFICKQQPSVLKLLLLNGLIGFFVLGITLVGSPFMIRTILGLDAGYYGFAQSLVGLCAILGAIAAGLLIGTLKTSKLSYTLIATGVFLLPVGMAFLLPTNTITKYVLHVIALCGIQIVASIFTIFIFSIIQQKTPINLMGKVMAYCATISLCVQPLGQIVYGLLFDRFSHTIYLVLIPTSVIVCMIGLISIRFFRKLESQTIPHSTIR